MTGCEVRFGADRSDNGSFRLLELPPDLLKLIETSIENSTSPNLTIKGHPTDDAVLCTQNKTYTLRSVVLSNSICIVTAPEYGEEVNDGDGEGEGKEVVVIRDQVSEVLEVVPCVPKLDRLGGLLKGLEYDIDGDLEEGGPEWDGDGDVEMGSDEEVGGMSQVKKPSGVKKLTLEDARREIQASEYELERGLRDRRILQINGTLRPLRPSSLTTILTLLLNTLVSLSLPHSAAPVDELTITLLEEHEIRREVCRQVMLWFGQITPERTTGEKKEEKWSMDVESVVKEIGLGILRNHKDEPIRQDLFLSKWREEIGDTFSSSLSLSLLTGNYLSHPPLTSPSLTYFPSSSLPPDPSTRFSDLFLTRPRWRAEDLYPFLEGVAVDGKERDKLLLKFARAVGGGDGEGVWYSSRGKV
ncbi:hypothetical protein JAAARDRAFT_197354 [Jaapia argillacea MUCL 33604]|uniref:Sister chromatid cohesion protein DCC1 n=1 Tax=Jaapia argillacea MUCL 33604 TaxID=933084 RepID=A0A067PT72_9AGAM|nr:hypothetical protein JAAARDRAFT_197354 [Jaapia argillacea MUCL 33604]